MIKNNKKEKHFDIVSKFKIWFTVPAVLILITLIMYGIFAGVNHDAKQGIAIGVEFQGGTLLKINTQTAKDSQNINISKLEKDIIKVIEEHKGNVNYVQKSSGNKTLMFKYSFTKIETGQTAQSINDEIKNKISKIVQYNTTDDFNNSVTTTFIGPTAAKRLVSSALISILISTLLILIYILIRFELFSAIAAIITLTLDVLTMFCGMVIFHVQINSAFIAAVITAVAYSINNTIVIFDRVRENYKLLDYHKYDVHFIVNKSVRDTLTRSIATTATTAFGITLFGIIGIASIQEFAYPVIFSLISGLFTSVCVAPSIFTLLKERQIKKFGDKALPFKIKK